MTTMQTPIFPADLAATLGIQIKTIARLIKIGIIPPYDVRLTAKTRYWHRSTLIDKKVLSAVPE